MSKGYVYILSNPAMPGLVKIGKTCRSSQARASELFQTGVPQPFKVEFEVLSPDCDFLERKMHDHFPDVRVDPGREFFRTDVETATGLLEEFLREQVEEWLGEFMPDHGVVRFDEMVDLGGFKQSVYDAMNERDLVPPEFIEVLYQLDGEDISAACARQKAISEERARRYREEKKLRVVGDE